MTNDELANRIFQDLFEEVRAATAWLLSHDGELDRELFERLRDKAKDARRFLTGETTTPVPEWLDLFIDLMDAMYANTDP